MYQVFLELQINLPANDAPCLLEELLSGLLKEKPVPSGDICKRCNRVIEEKTTLVRLPPVLTVRLMRFDTTTHSQQVRKKTNIVKFGFRLDMGKLDKKATLQQLYQVAGIVNFYGDPGSGHFKVSCYSDERGCWHSFDDSNVTLLPEEDVVTSAAYLLFYHTIRFVPRGLKNLGNQCYMSSIFQCLCNLQTSRIFFEVAPLFSWPTEPSQIRGELAGAFANLLRALHDKSQNRAHCPTEMVQAVRHKMTAFANQDHQDAHEFLIAFMDELHAELVRVHQPQAMAFDVR